MINAVYHKNGHKLREDTPWGLDFLGLSGASVGEVLYGRDLHSAG